MIITVANKTKNKTKTKHKKEAAQIYDFFFVYSLRLQAFYERSFVCEIYVHSFKYRMIKQNCTKNSNIENNRLLIDS